MSNLAKQTPQNTAIANLRGLLEQSKGKLAEVMPRHLTADRLMRVALAACTRTPALLKCSQASILQSIMQAAQLGLEPGSALGEAYLVPYRETCQLIVGYRGLISLARRSGQIASIEAHAVHAKDKFTCRYGLDSILEHEPDWSEDPGAMVAVYAVARLKDGAVQVEVMTKAQVDGIRKRSMASGSGPWVSDYEEMARKTVVRRLCKYLPLSIELADAIEREETTESGPVLDVVPEGEEKKTRTQRIRETLAAAKAVDGATDAPADPTLEPGEDPPSMGGNGVPVHDEVEGTTSYIDRDPEPA